MDKITLRNTINGVPATFDASYARRLLADPHYGKILKVVDSEKPEVLAQPYEVDHDEDELIYPFADPNRSSTIADDVEAYEEFAADKDKD